MKNETETKKQPYQISMQPSCHIKLKATAALTRKPMGEVIWILLNKFEPGVSVEDDLTAIEVMAEIVKDEAEDNLQAEQALAKEV